VGVAREDVLRAQGLPVETINLSVELDAADQVVELHRDNYLTAWPSALPKSCAALGNRK
jgi:hypothetical protein